MVSTEAECLCSRRAQRMGPSKDHREGWPRAPPPPPPVTSDRVKGLLTIATVSEKVGRAGPHPPKSAGPRLSDSSQESVRPALKFGIPRAECHARAASYLFRAAGSGEHGDRLQRHSCAESDCFKSRRPTAALPRGSLVPSGHNFLERMVTLAALDEPSSGGPQLVKKQAT